MASLNPLDYKPAQIAKSLISALTGIIGLLGLAALAFTDGPLSAVGGWATAAALFLTPILVFLQRAQPWMDMLGGSTLGAASESD